MSDCSWRTMITVFARHSRSPTTVDCRAGALPQPARTNAAHTALPAPGTTADTRVITGSVSRRQERSPRRQVDVTGRGDVVAGADGRAEQRLLARPEPALVDVVLGEPTEHCLRDVARAGG